MHILIADDDRLVRYTLKSMLSDFLNAAHSISEAADGKAFLAECVRQKPDIAFVDIDMPFLDGISAIEQAKQLLPHTQFVILTGHSEFHYAQKSVSLGVTEYLLKPPEPQKLQALFQHLCARIQELQKAENTAFAANVMQSLAAMEEIGEDAAACAPLCAGMSYFCFEWYVDCLRTGNAYAAAYRELRAQLSCYGEELLKSGVYSALLYADNGNLRFVLLCQDEMQAQLQKSLSAFCKASEGAGVMVSASLCTGKSLAQLYGQALQQNAFAWRRFGVPASILLPLCEEKNTEAHSSAFLQSAEAVANAFAAADEMAYKKAVQQLVQTPPHCFENAKMRLGALLGTAFTSKDAKALGKELLALVPQMYSGVSAAQESDKIEQMKAYINANYASDISIHLLSEKFYLTPNYISRLFHEKSGQRFVDYLTAVRIANAKKLLKQNPGALIKDIAAMVGYFSAKHFSAVFKRETGEYPADFRAKG